VLIDKKAYLMSMGNALTVQRVGKELGYESGLGKIAFLLCK
jgi:hypothetical protein